MGRGWRFHLNSQLHLMPFCAEIQCLALIGAEKGLFTLSQAKDYDYALALGSPTATA
jgi:hypothetical protein